MVAVVTVLVPHFKYPFAIHATGAEVVEQDTWEDVAQCVQILLTTSPGERVAVPTYGIEEFVFESDVAPEKVINSVLLWEERAQINLTSNPDLMDALIRRAKIALEVRT